MKLKKIFVGLTAAATLAAAGVGFTQTNQVASAKTIHNKKHKKSGTYGSSYNKAYTNAKVESILTKKIVSYVNGERKENGRHKWVKSTALNKLAKFRADNQNYTNGSIYIDKNGKTTSPIKGAVADGAALGTFSDTAKVNTDVNELPFVYSFTPNAPFHINDINNIFNNFKGSISNTGSITGDNNSKNGNKYYGIGIRITNQNKIIVSIICASNKY